MNADGRPQGREVQTECGFEFQSRYDAEGRHREDPGA
jgi:hypothetical protein